MTKELYHEVQRLVRNAAMRREDLLFSALRRSAARKRMSIVAGVLALFSAGALSAVLSRLFGEVALEYLAAVTALVSGTVTLVVAAYYSDEDVISRLAGSSKYLALRDSAYRLAVESDLTDKARLRLLADLQNQYADLDSAYSKYFSLGKYFSSQPPRLRDRDAEARARQAVDEDLEEFDRRLSVAKQAKGSS